MIKTITLTNYLNESLTIDMFSPEESGLAVKSIDGLGPAKATISISNLASMDGGLFNSARIESRSLSLTFLLVPNEQKESIKSVEKVRQLVYKYLPIKKKARVTIVTDERSAYVEGYVETCEPVIFSDKAEIAVSLLCNDPWFYSSYSERTRFSGVNGMFSFPFYSTEDDPIVVGDIYARTENNVPYTGDSETGVVIYVHALGPATNLKIYNTKSHERMFIDDDKLETLTGSKLTVGDDLIISTISGQKFVYLQRDGYTYNVLNALNRDADWFQLAKGDNLFAYTTDDDGSSSPTNLVFDVVSTVVYEGV